MMITTKIVPVLAQLPAKIAKFLASSACLFPRNGWSGHGLINQLVRLSHGVDPFARRACDEVLPKDYKSMNLLMIPALYCVMLILRH